MMIKMSCGPNVINCLIWAVFKMSLCHSGDFIWTERKFAPHLYFDGHLRQSSVTRFRALRYLIEPNHVKVMAKLYLSNQTGSMFVCGTTWCTWGLDVRTQQAAACGKQRQLLSLLQFLFCNYCTFVRQVCCLDSRWDTRQRTGAELELSPEGSKWQAVVAPRLCSL